VVRSSCEQDPRSVVLRVAAGIAQQRVAMPSPDILFAGVESSGRSRDRRPRLGARRCPRPRLRALVDAFRLRALVDAFRVGHEAVTLDVVLLDDRALVMPSGSVRLWMPSGSVRLWIPSGRARGRDPRRRRPRRPCACGYLRLRALVDASVGRISLPVVIRILPGVIRRVRRNRRSQHVPFEPAVKGRSGPCCCHLHDIRVDPAASRQPPASRSRLHSDVRRVGWRPMSKRPPCGRCRVVRQRPMSAVEDAASSNSRHAAWSPGHLSAAAPCSAANRNVSSVVSSARRDGRRSGRGGLTGPVR